MRFSFAKELNIKVPDEGLDLILGSEEEELEVFEKLDEFYHIQSLISLFIVFEVGISLGCVHTTSVLEEECA